MIIKFGKYKGRTVKWVMYNDRRYFNWAQENVPNMFQEEKEAKPVPEVKPASKLEMVGDEEAAADSWTNPHAFFKIAQAMRERGEI